MNQEWQPRKEARDHNSAYFQNDSDNAKVL